MRICDAGMALGEKTVGSMEGSLVEERLIVGFIVQSNVGEAL
jgi:hypothetical protein